MDILGSITLRSNGERFYVDWAVTERAHEYGISQVKARRSVRLASLAGEAEGADTLANMIRQASNDLGNQIRIAWSQEDLF